MTLAQPSSPISGEGIRSYPCIMHHFFLVLLFMSSASLVGETEGLRVHASNRYLETTEGEPFFWLADTAWELTNRLELDEVATYLDNRAQKGFTVILTNAISHWAFQRPNPNGDFPFEDPESLVPVESYFARLDQVLAMIAERGFVIALLPTWGDKFHQHKGAGPEVFNGDNSAPYTRFLAKRYRHLPIVWVLGGDRIPRTDMHYAVIDAMAEGIREIVGDRQLITYHPWGNQGSDNFFHHRKWLDFNMVQSGHYAPDPLGFQLIERAYVRTPLKPVIEAEPCYEDHPIHFDPANGWFTDFEPRRAAYWALLSGSAGHSYGHHSVWQFYSDAEEPVSSARTEWIQALDYPGAHQMTVLRRFYEELPWWRLQPRQELLETDLPHPGATPRFALDSKGAHALAYSPYGMPFSLNLNELAGRSFEAEWVNPKTGHRIALNQFAAGNESLLFDPPFDIARGNDWILHLRATP